MKSVKAVQAGMPFVCQLGIDTPYSLSVNFFLQYFGLYRTEGPNSCPRVTGIISRAIKSDNEFKLLLMFGCLRSFWQETDSKELIAEFIWAESEGVELDNRYLTFTFDNEDGEDWGNYTTELSGSDFDVPSDARLLMINIGFGRGDTGIENNEYLWQYFLNFQ